MTEIELNCRIVVSDFLGTVNHNLKILKLQPFN